MKIFVKAKPGSKTEKVERTDNTLFAAQEEAHFVISVRERPIEGRANEAIRKAIAHHFSIPISHVTMISGATSRNKIFEIPD